VFQLLESDNIDPGELAQATALAAQQQCATLEKVELQQNAPSVAHL
jgi:hypothetical protein